MRIFIGPVEIAGVAKGISDGMRELGVDAVIHLSVAHPFGYTQEPANRLLRVWQRLGAARAETPRSQFFRKISFTVAHIFWSWLILALAIVRFDAFIFLFGKTITNSRLELWLLYILKRKIAFVYMGSDVRPPYMDGGTFCDRTGVAPPQSAAIRAVAERRKYRIKMHEKYANYLINAPATAHFNERPYINWYVMGIPRKVNIDRQAQIDSPLGAKLRILHSPSDPLVKGTATIVDVVERLSVRYPIELIQIQGMPNEQVLDELERCDFVVDQLYSDTPLAGFATEAAFFGKPAVVGGYFSAKVGQYLDADDIPPSLFVAPTDLETAVERLIVDADFRHDLGERAQRFVRQRWNCRAVAERYLKLLTDEVPPHWWCDPKAVSYIEGCGLPRERVRQLVKELLAYGGVSALFLADKPDLEAAFCALAAEDVADA